MSDGATRQADRPSGPAAGKIGGRPNQEISLSAYYALTLITLASVFNYMDRQIISILAENIKADLRLDDAQMGFLLGTSFAVFYSIVGLAMGSVADRASRKKVMAAGVAIWSVMTMLGGAASNFLVLSVARFGVGVGESTTNPCAHSLLTQIFPPRRWSLVLGTYLTSASLGGGAAMILGGLVLQYWDDTCTIVPLAGACGLAPWKATLFLVGFPGLIVAALLLTIQEPDRETNIRKGALRFVMREIFAALPLVSLDNIRRTGGLAAAFINLRVGALIAAVAALLAVLTGDAMQWGSLGIGAYAIATWAQRYYLSDRPLYSVTFGDSTFVLTVLAITLIGSIVGTVGFWTAPYAMRTFVDRSPVEIGTYLAVAYTSGAIGGVVLGGWITDRWKTKTRKAPAILPAIQILCFAPVLCAMMLVSDFPLFVLCYLATGLLTSVHSGGFHALVQDLVLPRMRGSASACQALISIIIIFGTGPYLAGKVSTVTGSLATGILSVLLLVPVTLYVLWTLAARLDAVTPEQRQAIAAAAGEPPVSPS